MKELSNWKPAAALLVAVLIGLLFLVVGVDGVLTGRMSRRGYSGSGFSAGRAFGCALIFLGLAWFRALWMLGSSSAFDLEDGPLRFLILLAAVSIAVSLPLLFLDVAF